MGQRDTHLPDCNQSTFLLPIFFRIFDNNCLRSRLLLECNRNSQNTLLDCVLISPRSKALEVKLKLKGYQGYLWQSAFT